MRVAALLLVALAPSVGCSLITDTDHLRNGVRDAGGDGSTARDGGEDAGGDVADAATDAATPSRLFIAGGAVGSMHPSDVLASDVSGAGTLGAWSPASDLPASALANGVARSGPYVYVVGADDVGNASKTVRVAKITGTTLSDWALGAPLSAARLKLAAVATDKFLYAIGGEVGSTVLTDVEVAPIQADGSLGAFTKTTSLPAPRLGHAAATAGDRIWVMGGSDAPSGGSTSASILEAKIQPSGGLSAWTTLSTAVLPSAPYAPFAVVANHTLYVVGGYGVHAVAWAPILASGDLGAFHAGSKLAGGHSFAGVTVAGNRLFVLGGFDDDNMFSVVVESAELAPDGSLGAFQTLAPLPAPRVFHVAFSAP